MENRKTNDTNKTDRDEDNRDTTSLPVAEGTVSGQGREGGRLARDVGTRDELKRATERPAGKTRVRKSNEEEGGA